MTLGRSRRARRPGSHCRRDGPVPGHRWRGRDPGRGLRQRGSAGEGCETWLGRPWVETVTVESRPKIAELLQDAAPGAVDALAPGQPPSPTGDRPAGALRRHAPRKAGRTARRSAAICGPWPRSSSPRRDAAGAGARLPRLRGAETRYRLPVPARRRAASRGGCGARAASPRSTRPPPACSAGREADRRAGRRRPVRCRQRCATSRSCSRACASPAQAADLAARLGRARRARRRPPRCSAGEHAPACSCASPPARRRGGAGRGAAPALSM